MDSAFSCSKSLFVSPDSRHGEKKQRMEDAVRRESSE